MKLRMITCDDTYPFPFKLANEREAISYSNGFLHNTTILRIFSYELKAKIENGVEQMVVFDLSGEILNYVGYLIHKHVLSHEDVVVELHRQDGVDTFAFDDKGVMGGNWPFGVLCADFAKCDVFGKSDE